MKRLLQIAAISALGVTTAAGPQPALLKMSDLTSRPRPVPTTTVRYGTDPLQVVDLWLPTGRGPFPTVLMIHGGCWQTDVADRHLMDWAAEDLRRRGFAVWNIDYRGVDRSGGGYPGTFLDVACGRGLARPARSRIPPRHTPCGRRRTFGRRTSGAVARGPQALAAQRARCGRHIPSALAQW